MTPRPSLTAPLPPDPNPPAPKATEGVTVSPKTEGQLRRSAFYEGWTAFWLAAPGVLVMLGGMTGTLQTLFPRYAAQVVAVCSICAALGKGMRASQLGGSAKELRRVNFTDKE